MNQGAWKRFWTWCQSVFGAGWIHFATYNIMNIYGLENVEAVSRDRPILLVANQSPLGLFVNLVMGWWSMYPPFFASGEKPMIEKREFDKYSVRLLSELCRNGEGNVIGFHPEGTRNKGADPYSYLPAQPGVGKLIKDAAPQVIPVFITGLGNDLPKQVMGNWRGGEQIRIYFGPQLDLTDYLAKPDRIRTYKEIADFVMRKIAELGEQDRASCVK